MYKFLSIGPTCINRYVSHTDCRASKRRLFIRIRARPIEISTSNEVYIGLVTRRTYIYRQGGWEEGKDREIELTRTCESMEAPGLVCELER